MQISSPMRTLAITIPRVDALNKEVRVSGKAGNGSGEVAVKAQQLLEHSLLSELRAVVARALSGLEMFAGSQLTELDLLGAESFDKSVPQVRGVGPSSASCCTPCEA